MARSFDARWWPLPIAASLLLLAAAVNFETLRIPNWLTLPSILAAWLAALAVSGRVLPSRGGGIGPSLLLTFFAGMLLAPLYGAEWLGAGCVKMHMALGAWIGCALPAEKGAKVTLVMTLVGGLATVAGFVIQTFLLGRLEADYWPLFPAQVTLSLGAIAVLCAVPFVGRQPTDEIASPTKAREAGHYAWTTKP